MNADPIEPRLDMPPTKEAIDTLYREDVLRARRMSPEDKFLAGPRLFDYACRVTMDGIRHQFPGIDEQRTREILRQRLVWQRHRDAYPSSAETPRES